MRLPPAPSHLPMMGLVLFAAACGQPAPVGEAVQTGATETKVQLALSLDECSRETGYWPVPSGTAETALGSGELAWRQCAYDAVRAYAADRPGMTGLYEQLIAEDIAMTTAIQLGTMTRSERSARLDELFAQVRVAEEQDALRRQLAERQKQDHIRQIVDSAVRFR